MELKLFTDLIDALGKVAGGLKALVQFPKTEREKMRNTLDETYRLIDTTLNMVIIRLGDIGLLDSDDHFLSEAARLDNWNDWMQAEREFRLCRSLRVALRETKTLTGGLAGKASTEDWDALVQQMEVILPTEQEVAVFIGRGFQQLADEAREALGDLQQVQSVRASLSAFRASLVAERQTLIQQELTLWDAI